MRGRNMNRKNKKGAASFYVVAFSTLILVIMAASFAAIIVSEISRTSNDDLAQSAYDSALAGVEDAKVAFSTYQGCMEDEIKPSNEMDCATVKEIVKPSKSNSEEDKCDMVPRILGRSINEEDGSVLISESNIEDNHMLQAYTCVFFKTDLPDYRSVMTSSKPVKVIPVKLADGIKAKSIKKLVIEWFSDAEAEIPNYGNYLASGEVGFSPATLGISEPPSIGVTLIQTGGEKFSMDSFTMTQGDRTNRGTVYLVPTNVPKEKRIQVAGKATYRESEYLKIGNNGTNYIDKKGFLYSNDKTSTNQNLPYLVYCGDSEGKSFYCSATIEIPEPIGGDRNEDTFYFATTLLYGEPKAEFSFKLYCDNDNDCTPTDFEPSVVDGNEEEEEEIGKRVTWNGAQIAVDSTGKANDLFRRVEVRLEPSDQSFPYPTYGVQLFNTSNNNSTIEKNLDTVCEWNFPNVGCPE